ncbi:hypothetical protein [Flavisolibacter tropicus]|uniref:Uncharacterized protein n=1 Tax=Flavisolibacter tropicus TaxID=1492898 RepID=A0A172TQJ8_9BACT|nr:hypothetical protein [Flavisolibacter tropicus]ANE49256.1 hypothetical protein SY85_00790 [Flavisolibacter tropicus]
MISAVCTLFEDHYHKGVVGLVNSLYKNGYRGDFYAGYKGRLPKWASQAKENLELNWQGAKTMHLGEDLHIHFLPIITNYHLSSYKPKFMISLLRGVAKAADALAYFDPDIIALCRWGFYNKWMSYGVAMVHEVVKNDMPATHPCRMEWYEIIRLINKEPKRQIHSYINSGFCGVTRCNIEFLEVWSKIIEVAINEYNIKETAMMSFDKTSVFYFIDQDAFNIAAMCADSPISEMGPEAMDFVGSGWTMSHAAGWPKPWKNKFIISSLRGIPPCRPHKYYWDNLKSPIKLHGSLYVMIKKAEISIASLISRFYKR